MAIGIQRHAIQSIVRGRSLVNALTISPQWLRHAVDAGRVVGTFDRSAQRIADSPTPELFSLSGIPCSDAKVDGTNQPRSQCDEFLADHTNILVDVRAHLLPGRASLI